VVAEDAAREQHDRHDGDDGAPRDVLRADGRPACRLDRVRLAVALLAAGHGSSCLLRDRVPPSGSVGIRKPTPGGASVKCRTTAPGPSPSAYAPAHIEGEPVTERRRPRTYTRRVTPSALADLVRSSAVTVLEARGLDTGVLPEQVTVERPRNPEHGDYATNVALQVAKKVGMAPRELADALAAELAAADGVESAEVAGPGFLNLRLAADAQGEIVNRVLAEGEAFGRGDALAGTRINLEFVSANPTGPIHLGGTRWAAVGDALGRVLSAQGAEVTREYYFNDAGAQIDRFVSSLLAAAQGQPA